MLENNSYEVTRNIYFYYVSIFANGHAAWYSIYWSPKDEMLGWHKQREWKACPRLYAPEL
jgi:hypothetical protein